MPKPQGECPFCGRAIPKFRACVCPGCQRGIAEGALGSVPTGHDAFTGYFVPRGEDQDEYREGRLVIRDFKDEEIEEESDSRKETETDESVLTGLSQRPDTEAPDAIAAMFTAAEVEGREKRHRPYVDKEDRAAIAKVKAGARAARQWDTIAAKAKALVAAQPWTLHEGGGGCFLKRWVDRTEELRRVYPPDMEPPRVAPVFGQVWTVDGKPLVVPIRRKAELQKVLDEHQPGLRLADLVRSRSRPGRRRRTEERTEIPEWERDEQEIKLLAARRFRIDDLVREDPGAVRYFVLRRKWLDSKKCRRCQNFIVRSSRRVTCGTACKHALKRGRSSH